MCPQCTGFRFDSASPDGRGCHDAKVSERGRSPRLSDARLRVLGYAVATVSVAFSAAAYAAHQMIEARVDVGPIDIANLVVGACWPLAGAAVVRAQPRNRCGWLLLATGLLALYELLCQYSLWSLRVAEQALPGAMFTDWVSMFGFAVYFYVLPLLPLWFPDGHVIGRRWQMLSRVVVVVATVAVVGRMVAPGQSDTDAGIRNPLGVSALDLVNLIVLAGAMFCIVVATHIAVIGLILRTRRAVGVERAQLQWLMLGGIVLALGIIISTLSGGGSAVNQVFFALGMLGPPLGVAVAMLRHRLFDVEFALNRTAVLLAVVAVVGSGWAAVVLTLDPELGGTRPGLVVIAVLAVIAVVGRDLIQRLVDRWWFPQRQESTALLSQIALSVSVASEPDEALAELVASLRTVLRLPYVGFRGVGSACAGSRPSMVEAVVATALGHDMGVLEVAERRVGEGFSKGERVVLDQVAAHAAMLAYAGSLVGDVAESRARIVRAREEERRRLRNDLHDGVGPSLAGIALQIEALAARLDDHEDDSVAGEARAIRDRVRESVADVRAVSHGLRPPILDQIGLVEALRQLVRDLGPIQGIAQIDDLVGLSAASEVAMYAIASEAVSNAMKHSSASSLRIDLESSEGRLRLRISDNGRGMPTRPRNGVGLTSMRHRASEVGGRLQHLSVDGGGTMVELVLPIDEADGVGVRPEAQR